MIFITLLLYHARFSVNLYSIYEEYKDYRSRISACLQLLIRDFADENHR